MVKLIRKTVTIHPSVDKIIRVIQIRLIKLGYDYDYSAALNGVIAGAVYLSIARGEPDPEIVRNVRKFLANMDTEEIPSEILEQYEQYAGKMDKILDRSDKVTK